MQLNNHLAELLRQLYEGQTRRSWAALETYIRNANDGKITVDRRKLKRIYDGDEKVCLSIEELRALQIYFCNKQLIPIDQNILFKPPVSLLDALHGESKLSVFYSARYLEIIRTEVASDWDLRAVAELLGTHEIGNLAVSLHDVFNFGRTHNDVTTLTSHLKNESWYTALNKERALVSIGSPFVSYATEEILCRMFGLCPFKPDGYSSDKPLPFYLYWPEEHKTTDSAFSISWEELKVRFKNKVADIGKNDRALVMGDNLYLANSVGTSPNLVLAQYWKGHLVLVLIGVFGPSTFAIAQCVANRMIAQTLPPYRTHQPKDETDNPSSPILMALIQTLIEKAPRKGRAVMRDHRELRMKETNILKTQLWQCKGDTWETL